LFVTLLSIKNVETKKPKSTQDFIDTLNSEFALHSRYLILSYSPHKGMHAKALVDVPFGAPAVEIPCTYILSYCRALS
jgi:hypothetical protein